MQPARFVDMLEDERDRQLVHNLIRQTLGPDGTLHDFYAWMNTRPMAWILMDDDLAELRIRPDYVPPWHTSPSFHARHRLMLDLAQKLTEETNRQQLSVSDFLDRPVDHSLKAAAARAFIENDNPAKMRERMACINTLLRLITNHEARPPSPVWSRRCPDPDVAAQFTKLYNAVGDVLAQLHSGMFGVRASARGLRHVVERFPFEYAAEDLYDEAFAIRVLPRAGRIRRTRARRPAVR